MRYCSRCKIDPIRNGTRVRPPVRRDKKKTHPTSSSCEVGQSNVSGPASRSQKSGPKSIIGCSSCIVQKTAQRGAAGAQLTRAKRQQSKAVKDFGV